MYTRYTLHVLGFSSGGVQGSTPLGHFFLSLDSGGHPDLDTFFLCLASGATEGDHFT